MYCKLFASLYQGTLRGRSNEILVFTNLLAHTGKDGTVDKHFRAIAEETGLSMDDVKAAIEVLESPDEESRSAAENGARIVRMDEHRVWGWRVVNYGKYRAIRSEEDRAEQNRIAQAAWREREKEKRNNSKQSKPPSAESNPNKPKEREEGNGDGKEEVNPEDVPPPAAPKRAPTDTDEEWLRGIEAMDCYHPANVRAELGKAKAWAATNRRQCTRRFFINWLNRSLENSRAVVVNGQPRKVSMGQHGPIKMI